MKKIKLKKCRGGIVIDDIPYMFKRKNPGGETPEPCTSSFTDINNVLADCHTIQTDFERLKGLFVKDYNLFVSSDDLKLVNKQLSKAESCLKELNVKIQNTRLLLCK